MFSIITGRILAFSVIGALLMGFGGGWTVQGWRLDNAVTKQQLLEEQLKNAALQQNLATIAAVLGVDAKKAAEDDLTLEEIDALSSEIAKAASDKPALSAPTVDGLRNLWDRK